MGSFFLWVILEKNQKFRNEWLLNIFFAGNKKVHSLKVKYYAKENAQQLEYLTYKVRTSVNIPKDLDADKCICKPTDPSKEWRVQARESPETHS